MTPGDILTQLKTNASAAAADSTTALTNLQSFVSQQVASKNARLQQINTTDLPDANALLQDMTTANDTQGVSDTQKVIADLNAELQSIPTLIAALNALLPTPPATS